MKFSIIIPTFNRAHIISATIQSALEQTFEDFEIIVVDDGSTDDTTQVIEHFEHPRLHYYKKTNAERGAARNYGASKAKGDYITFLDSDDLIYPQHLRTAYDETIKGTPIFWIPYEEVSESGDVLKPYTPSDAPLVIDLIAKGNFMSCHGVFIANEIFHVHRFSEIRELSGSEDLELWLRLASRYEIKKLDTVTHCLVHHDGRSVMNFDNIETLVRRKMIMIELIQQDSAFMSAHSERLPLLKSRSESYIALHAVLNKKISTRHAVEHAFAALRHCPSQLFTRRQIFIAFRLTIRLLRLDRLFD